MPLQLSVDSKEKIRKLALVRNDIRKFGILTYLRN